MTGGKRFKVVQNRRTGHWGILDTEPGGFDIQLRDFAPYGLLDGGHFLDLIVDDAARMNARQLEKWQFSWNRELLRNFD